PEFRAITGEARRRNFSDPDALTVRYLDEKTAYLSVNTFVNYRTPVDPIAVFEPIFREFKARGVERLILDNRNNGGGSTDVKNGLLAHLMETDFRGSKAIFVKTIDVSAFKPHLQTWEPMALNPPTEAFDQQENGWYAIKPEMMPELQAIEASPHRFAGELILLTSHANASGATQMTGLLKSRPNTRLVGEVTGGTQRGPNGGVIYFLTLPNSEFVIRIPWQFWQSSIENPVHGQGYSPDINVPDDYETWLAGEDTVLAAALNGWNGPS
ncbi:MAG: S41 family peptidase, partial [Pseudomonadota bacterium]